MALQKWAALVGLEVRQESTRAHALRCIAYITKKNPELAATVESADIVEELPGDVAEWLDSQPPCP